MAGAGRDAGSGAAGDEAKAASAGAAEKTAGSAAESGAKAAGTAEETGGKDSPGSASAGGDVADAGAADEAGGVQVTVVPGIARYHLPDCILIRFLSESDLETMTREAAEAASCIPCKACRPDK